MKTTILSGVFALVASISCAQENKAILSGGYVFANLEDFDVNATGWRINGLYEYKLTGTKVSHGISVGYISTRASTSLIEYDISTIPVYYAPKFTFGEKSLQGFIKGAIGYHFATINRVGTSVNDHDTNSGFYSGLALGGVKNINEKLSINIEYEWAFMFNSFYRDGFLNSISLGIGYSF